MNKIFLFCCATSICFAACNKKDKNDTGGGSNFDQSAMLANMSDNIIVPAYQDFADQSDKLLAALTTFTGNPTDESLTDVQTQFKTTYKSFLHVEPFDFGPANSTVMLINSVDYWPTKPDLINTELSAGTTIDANYVASLGAEKKGLPALAYLLFDRDAGNESVIDSFSVSGVSERRKTYALALAQDISAKAKSVAQEWKDSYAATFKTNTGTELNTSLSLLLNNFVINLETSKNKRLGIPIGRKDNFTEGPVDPTAVELPTTEFARDMLLESATVLHNIYLGKSAAGDGQGFDDYAASLNEDGVALNDSLKTEFTAFEGKIGQMVSPMQQSIQADKTPVYNSWVESKKLLVLLKVDLAADLGILITFSDNDGD